MQLIFKCLHWCDTLCLIDIHTMHSHHVSAMQVVAQQLELFETADEESLHFGESRHTSVRCVRRYLTQASSRASTAKNEDDKRAAELMQKQLAMIESCQKLFSEWMNKRSIEHGVSVFMPAWRSLETFLNTPPVVPLKCNFMWHLVLRVTAHQSMTQGVRVAFVWALLAKP